MAIAVTVRNFTGKAVSLSIDPTTKVSEVKDIIARTSGKGVTPALAYKGHELRDHQTLSHYDIVNRDVLHILPPSNVLKVSLQFENTNGDHFTLELNSDLTIAQLKREITIEEKIDVPKLRYVSSLDEPEDPDALVVSEPQDLPDEELISQYPLSDSIIFICGPPPPVTPPPSFKVLLMLDDQRKLDVETKLQQTLNDFREAVRVQHNVFLTEHVLILVGKEVVGDEIPIWDLGFVPDCTVHAVAFVSVDVEILSKKTFDPMFLHPLTRLSTIRKRLEQEAPEDVALDKYWFTLDGKEHLKEWRNLWGLGVVSGSTLYMRTSVISVTIRMNQSTGSQVDVEEDETVWGLKERWALITGLSVIDHRMIHRGKVLQDGKTLRQEGLVGGETLFCESGPSELPEYGEDLVT